MNQDGPLVISYNMHMKKCNWYILLCPKLIPVFFTFLENWFGFYLIPRYIYIYILKYQNKNIIALQVDFDPRHEAFWFVGGVDVPTSVLKWRRKSKWCKGRLHAPIDRPAQYLGNYLIIIDITIPFSINFTSIRCVSWFFFIFC